MTEMPDPGESRPAIQSVNDLADGCSLPGPLLRVLEAIRDEHSTKYTVARALEQDPDLAERVLRAANSPLYLTYEDHPAAQGSGITNLPTAVLRIGLSAVRNLAYTQGICQLAGEAGDLGQGILTHLLVVAEIGWSLGSRLNRPFAEDAYLAGLLHDFGKVALLKTLPTDYAAIAAWCRQHRQPTLRAEEECFARTQPFLLNHVKTGTELMRAHFMPENVLFTVEHHHDLTILDLHGRNPRHLTAVVITANLLAHLQGVGDGYGGPPDEVSSLEALAERLEADAADLQRLATDAIERARGSLAAMPRAELPVVVGHIRGGRHEPEPLPADLPQPVSSDYRAYEKLIGFARAIDRFSLQDLQAHTQIEIAALEDLVARLEDKGYLKRDRRHTYHAVYRSLPSLQRSTPQQILSVLAADGWRRPGDRRAA